MSSTPQPSEPPEPGESQDGRAAPQPGVDESFALHLARKLVVEQGFDLGMFPEAAELVAASDLSLTYSDGMSAVIVCIVDREREGSRPFGLDVTALERIGKECLKYTGSMSGTKLPLGLQVIEVGRTPATEEDRKRLESLRLGVFHKVHLHAMHVDVATGEVWANTWRRAKVSPRYLRRVLSEPRIIREEEPLAEPPERKSVLGPALLAAMVLGFAAEHFFGVGEAGDGLLAPGVRTLVALGGVNSGLVLQGGDWWRLLTAPLLHGDVFHLALNGLCLWFVMATVEGMVGRAWTGLLLLVGALGGGALSMAINADTVVSVGASGVLMGLLGALLALSRRLPAGPEKTQLQLLSVQLLVPSLIPIGMSRTGGEIDFAAHLGGALAGGAVGLLLARVWPRSAPVPPA
ncbi:rhomboid family intramembrane serine protease, partial [Pyxidicoccus sp. 3LG]